VRNNGALEPRHARECDANAGSHVFRKSPRSKTWMAGTRASEATPFFRTAIGERSNAVLSNGYGPAMTKIKPTTP